VATATVIPGWRAVATCFLAEDRIRTWFVPSLDLRTPWARAPLLARVLVFELAASGDTRTELVLLAPQPGVAGSPVVIPDAQGGRLLTDHGGLQLRDGATGSLIATLVEGSGRRSAIFLKDGRVAVVEGGPGQVRLRVFDLNGVPAAEARLDLPAADLPMDLGPEVTPGRVAVPSTGGRTLVVDLATLEVVERIEGLVPAPSATGEVSSPVHPGGSVHFFLGRGQLVRIDFSTGERKVVAGRGAPPGERISVR
jgi:hypothetical protein